MDVKANLNNLRIAPRKSRQVADLIRGKNVLEARSILLFTIKRAANPILKLLNSAVACALNNFKLEESNLFISKITVDEGPKLKRSNPESRGRAFPIMKRTSHIALVLTEKVSKKEGLEEKTFKKVTERNAKVKVQKNDKVKKIK